MVIYNHKQSSIEQLPEGFYFILKKTHTGIGGPRYPKSDLMNAINKREWNEDETIIEEANFPCLNNKKSASLRNFCF